MMKIHTSIAMIAASAMLVGITGAQDQAAPASDTNTQPNITVTPEQIKKNLGYFFGYQTGRQIGSYPTISADDFDQEAFMQAVKDGMTGAKPAVAQEEMQATLAAFQKVMDERLAALSAKNLEASKKFMEENGKKDGITTTKSGLQYKVVKAGGAEKFDEAKFKNPVFKLKYTGTLTDGTQFDSSNGQSVEFPLQVIPGFAEALKTMPIGAQWIVYIPAELAYGENSPTPAIPVNSALVFDIELEGIAEGPEAPQGGEMNISPEQLQEMLRQAGGQQ